MDELVKKLLSLYSLQDLLELSDVSEEEVVEFLIEQEIIKLPLLLPVDINYG